MIYTHHFAHRATMRHACDWLDRIGFGRYRVDTRDEGVPRLVFDVDPAGRAALDMLLHAVERSDPDGWPGFWDRVREKAPEPAGAPCPPPADAVARHAPIGWHPAEAGATADPTTVIMFERFNF